jgi:hypothetical protein
MDDEEKIKLTNSEGAIVIRDNSMPEIYAPLEVGDRGDSVRFTLAFLLYAIEREDWVMEFGDFVGTLQDKVDENLIKAKRSKFEVIDGDKK